MKNNFKKSTALLAAAVLMFASQGLQAQVFTFQVDVQTPGLPTAANGPFFLDFQLSSGGGGIGNTATLSNFSFTGGTATGSPTGYFGSTSGDMSSSIVLNDDPTTNFFSGIFQGFTAGTTDIKFTLSLTQNSGGATPDGFTLDILDSEDGNPSIPSTALDGFSLLNVAISNNNSLADVATYSSPLGAQVQAVPEPSAWAMMLAGGLFLVLITRHRSRRV